MKSCIVNYASHGWMVRGQQRLRASLGRVGFKGKFLPWRKVPAGCPPHQQSPYAFKPACMQEARKQGYDLILWLDASFWAIRPVEPIFETIEQEGFFLLAEGNNAGQWSTDAALRTFGVSREEAFGIGFILAGCLGLNMQNPKAVEFLDRWRECSLDGVTFPGPWHRDGLDTKDKRVRGHRHDMVAASIIKHQMGLPYIGNQSSVAINWENPSDQVILVYCGSAAVPWREAMRV